jgi:hypothetical protein
LRTYVREQLEHLAYELSLRALSQQEAVLGELRARAGALLTATAVVTSFLGGRALDLTGERLLALTGFAFAVIAIVLAVYVLAPKSDLDFSLSGPAVYEHFTARSTPFDEVERTLSYWNQDAWESNQTVLDALIRWFRRAIVALLIAVIIWSVELALN